MNKTKAILVLVIAIGVALSVSGWYIHIIGDDATATITSTYCLKYPGDATTNGHLIETYKLIHPSNGSFFSDEYGIVEIHTNTTEKNYSYILYDPYMREIFLEGMVGAKEAYMEEDWRYGKPEYRYTVINNIPSDSSLVIKDAKGHVMGINAAPKGRNVTFTKIFLDYDIEPTDYEAVLNISDVTAIKPPTNAPCIQSLSDCVAMYWYNSTYYHEMFVGFYSKDSPDFSYGKWMDIDWDEAEECYFGGGKREI